MKKYVVDIKNKELYARGAVNATAKPRTDFMKIAVEDGFVPLEYYTNNCPFKGTSISEKVLRRLFQYLEHFRMLLSLRDIAHIENSIILFQYPILHSVMRSHYLKRLKDNVNQIIALFHDLEEIRYENHGEICDNVLQYTDFAIYHTPEMEEKAVSAYGVRPASTYLEFFDYLNSFNRDADVNVDDIKVLYAGNLSKSEFLKDIHKVEVHDNMQFLIYGKPESAAPAGTKIIYKGSFNSEEISAVEGNWGLVWDGTSIDTCAGPLGEYLRINAPFKFSMSLALGIPVIVWTQSAMAQYVEKYHLGICVEKLDDIHDTVKNLSQEEIELITQGVQTYSQKVRKGYMLMNALNEAEEWVTENRGGQRLDYQLVVNLANRYGYCTCMAA